MIKKLQQEEKKDQENPERKGENTNEIVLSSKSFFAIIGSSHKISAAKQRFPQLRNSYTYNCTSSIFHPPNV
jgi:hypothetical protein